MVLILSSSANSTEGQDLLLFLMMNQNDLEKNPIEKRLENPLEQMVSLFSQAPASFVPAKPPA